MKKREEEKLFIELIDGNKTVITASEIGILSKETNQKTTYSKQIKNIKPWTAETPNLYTLLLTLKDKKGKTLEVISSKIGFRNVEIKEGQIAGKRKGHLYKRRKQTRARPCDRTCNFRSVNA